MSVPRAAAGRREVRRLVPFVLAAVVTATLAAVPAVTLIGEAAAVTAPHGAWSAVEAMADRRTATHTATLLADGRVLVLGGDVLSWKGPRPPGSTGPESTHHHRDPTHIGEIYDPAYRHSSTELRGKWEPIGFENPAPFNLRNGPRLGEGHTATRLDCSVLDEVPAGYPCEMVLITDSSSEAWLYDAARGTWIWAGVKRPNSDARSEDSLGPRRGGASAVLLKSGDVLVVDHSFEGSELIESAADDDPDALRTGVQLYEPNATAESAKGAWRDLMPSPVHTVQTATRLANGHVLVTGSQRQASVFNPATEAWAPTAPMQEGHIHATATLLDPPGCGGGKPEVAPGYPCGKVLLAGGYLDDGFESGRSATTKGIEELYDPSTRTWERAGALATAHVGHAATLLRDGSAIVAGGHTVLERAPGRTSTPIRRSPLPVHAPIPFTPSDPSSEIYDPLGQGTATNASGQVVKGSWRPAPQMVLPRREAAVVVLDAPGCPDAPGGYPCGQVLVAGGAGEAMEHDANSYESVGFAEVFDPAQEVQPPSVVNLHPATGRPEGGTELVVTGAGFDEVTNVRFGDEPSQFMVESPSRIRVAAPRRSGAAAVHVRVTTGAGTSPPTAAALFSYIGEPQVGTGPPEVVGVEPRVGSSGGGTTVRITGTGFGIGPVAVHFGELPAARVDLVSETAIVAISPPQPQRRVVPVAVTVSGRRSSDVESATFAYVGGHWSPTDPLQARYQHSATALDGPACRGLPPPGGYPQWCGKVLVAGGVPRSAPGRSGLASAQLYDPGTGRWTGTAPLATGRAQHTATLLASGKVLVAGGITGTYGDPLASAEVYDPETATWSPAGFMHNARFAHTATLLNPPACAGPSAPHYCGKVLVTGGSREEQHRIPTQAAQCAGPCPEGGGIDGSGDVEIALGSTELYDPGMGRSGTWLAAAPLESCPSPCGPRTDHAAALLPNGEVLVSGGLGRLDDSQSLVVLRSAQRYDALAGTWSAAADLAVKRFSHSATVIEGDRCVPRCGQVLVTGGASGFAGKAPADVSAVASTELYDPNTGRWQAAGVLAVPRVGHTATRLGDGRVLVAGRGRPFWEAVAAAGASSEVFDPTTGEWSGTDSLSTARGRHTATLLDGPGCRTALPPPWCGTVLATGGDGPRVDPIRRPLPALAGAEIYIPAPVVTALSPALGPDDGGTPVVVSGRQFRPGATVTVGGAPAAAELASPTEMRLTTPPGRPGPAEVAVTTAGGPSATEPPESAATFVYVGDAAKVDLAAVAVDERTVELSFSTPDDGTTLRRATSYVVKQARSQMASGEDFAAAPALCGGVCDLPEAAEARLKVGGLRAGTTYHFAVQALNALGEPGPRSASVAVTTPGIPPSHSRLGAGTVPCAPVADPGPSQLAYPAGYSLVGLPAGTVVAAGSPLWSWFDQGASGTYAGHDPLAGVEPGRGYWAWFSCPRVVTTSDVPAPRLRFTLGGYHASMVGNPSPVAPAIVSGHDFAASWDPALNDGAGGYHMSAYRQTERLAVGQGAWVFSYRSTTVDIGS